MNLCWFLSLVLALQQPTATIGGTVVDAQANVPVAGARVLLVRTDAALASSIVATTDDRGAFEARAAPPGTYRLFAMRDGYLRSELASPVTVAAGEARRGVAIALRPTGVITGRVLNEHGDPASKVYVRCLMGDRVVGETRTNDLGEYRLFDLAPGQYVVLAERYKGPRVEGTFYVVPTPPCPDCPGEGEGRQSLAALLKTGGYVDPGVLTGATSPAVYYPGVMERGAAKPVDVWAGAEIYGIDFRLVRR